MTESVEETYPEEEFVPLVAEDDETVEAPEDSEWRDGESPYDRIADPVQDPDVTP